MSTQSPKGCSPRAKPDLFFEEQHCRPSEEEIWEASDAQIDAWLAEYGLPAPGCEWPSRQLRPDTVRHQVEANRKKNDVILVPVGCTENHGQHM